jgi:diguanylate cyclase (GGDEF)-like protein
VARLLALALVLAAPTQTASAQTSPKPTPLPTLTTINAVHRLSSAEAARGYPVHLKAVITYYDPFIDYPKRPLMMTSDGTASIYTGLTGQTALPLKPGLRIEIHGISNPGEFGPNISQATVRILGPSVLPLHPPRQSMTHLLTGSEDAQFVELEGVFQSAEPAGPDVTLKLALADGEMAVTTVREPGVDYNQFIDAKVLVRGIAASLFTLHNQIFGVRLLMPNISAITIEEPAPAKPFELPVSPASSLMQYSPGKVFPRRVHLRGVVTLFWPGRTLCIADGSGPLCAQTDQSTPLTPGQVVDLLGFPRNGAITPTLSDATYQALPGTAAATALPIDADAAFGRTHDSQLVQMTGRLIAHDRASQDPTLVVSSGKYTFQVVLPRTADARSLVGLEEGSLLSIKGICSVETDPGIFTRHDGYPIAKSFRILLGSAPDVVVLQRPSWWNAKHTLSVLALALLLALAMLCWTVFLSIRIRRQSRLMQYQATHDGLTGVWNRKAVLDLMRREFEIAARANQTFGVLMLDADHFKRVNDTYGHLAGDAVLKELAQRIQDSIRSYDFTGRYGGEEFLVVLPSCSRPELLDCAERIRAAIARKPIQAEGTDLRITVSIGAAVLDPFRNTEKDALASADAALYQAKHSGRNQVVAGNLLPGMVPASAG